MSRARRIWPTATRAHRAALVWPLPRPVRVRRTWSRALLRRCSIRFRWCALPARSRSKVLGSDAFQEVDITGITLPVTKHNFSLTERGRCAHDQRSISISLLRAGRAGAGGHHQGCAAVHRDFDFEAAAPRPISPHPLPTSEGSIKQAAGVICNSKRPVILAGHGIIRSGAMEQFRTFAERANIPVGCTLLGLGSFPCFASAESRDDGDARRSLGEQRDPGSRLADRLGMRFDDRVTGNAELRAEREENPHRDRSRGGQQECHG